ncbi:HORMA domain-containing protein [Microdochium trichocladiopsis]|uniref:HORMA domain-containing protein n=1 Tax=Microdochium trichocladiopsis TaxID=1682393 RepID=A0A9P9BX55_9PEZI|nr:HORMA domain-containing protein [Microdochium trichocladiopsis]KAH7035746.1 HORMA domain-containing protein [Microdochium trichocladiopsis]
MATTPLADGQAVSLAQASHLLGAFVNFLTVCVHNILYYRAIYPQESFLTTRAYNLPVHQSRHPKVCDWVRDALDAVKAQLVLGTVERLAVVIYDSDSRVMERWMFDLATFPAWTGVKDLRTSRSSDAAAEPEDSRLNWTDIDEQLRAAVRRLAYAGEKMGPLPDGCTFTIAVELHEQSEAPIGHPQPWIPTLPSLQTPSKTRQRPGADVGGARTTPVRSVEAGPLFFECWIEEGKAKFEPKHGELSSSGEPVSSGD